MRRLTHNRAIALLLGLWVALAPALLALPAAAMAVEMSQAGGAPDCCADCPEVDRECNGCAAMCRAAGQFATLPGEAQGRYVAVDAHALSPGPAPPGHAPPPDPDPPKTVSLP